MKTQDLAQDIARNVRKFVRIEAKPGLAGALRAALLDLERATREEPGCREFRFFQALSDDNAFLLLEDFADADALNQHMALPHTRAFFGLNLTASITPFERG